MPAEWKLELRRLKETQAKATQMLRDLQGEPMVEAMRDSTLLVQRSGRQYASVDTGRWRASITPEVRVSHAEVVGVVGSNLVYAPFAHDGSRPHWPPISAIQAWVHRKGIGGTVRGQGRVSRASSSVEAGIAYLIARRIARRGTKGDRALTRAIEDNQVAIKARIDRAVGRIVER